MITDPGQIVGKWQDQRDAWARNHLLRSAGSLSDGFWAETYCGRRLFIDANDRLNPNDTAPINFCRRCDAIGVTS